MGCSATNEASLTVPRESAAGASGLRLHRGLEMDSWYFGSSNRLQWTTTKTDGLRHAAVIVGTLLGAWLASINTLQKQREDLESFLGANWNTTESESRFVPEDRADPLNNLLFCIGFGGAGPG